MFRGVANPQVEAALELHANNTNTNLLVYYEEQHLACTYPFMTVDKKKKERTGYNDSIQFPTNQGRMDAQTSPILCSRHAKCRTKKEKREK